MGCLFTYFQNMARKSNRGVNIFETLPLDGSVESYFGPYPEDYEIGGL